MLDEQFFTDSQFHPYLNDNFVSVLAYRDHTILAPFLYKEYAVNVTPTVLIARADGSVLERVIGYGGEPDVFTARLENAVAGINTLASIKEEYDKNPDDINAMFKLANKYQDVYKRAEAGKLFKEIIAKGDDAKNAMVPYKEVSAYEYSKFLSGDYLGLIEEFPESELIKDAYSRQANMYVRSRRESDIPKAQKFYADMLEKFPNETGMKKSYVNFAVTKQVDPQKALEVAHSVYEDENMADPTFMKNYAELLSIGGDTKKLDEVYGENFPRMQKYTASRNMYNYSKFWVDHDENVDSALETAASLVKADPGYISRVAQLYIDADYADEALEMYGPDFIKDKMDEVRILSTYASFWGGQETNLKSALKAAKQAVKLDAKYYNYYTLGLVYWKSDKLKDALNNAEKAVELAPRPYSNYTKLVADIKKAMGDEGK